MFQALRSLWGLPPFSLTLTEIRKQNIFGLFLLIWKSSTLRNSGVQYVNRNVHCFCFSKQKLFGWQYNWYSRPEFALLFYYRNTTCCFAKFHKAKSKISLSHLILILERSYQWTHVNSYSQTYFFHLEPALLAPWNSRRGTVCLDPMDEVSFIACYLKVRSTVRKSQLI